MKKKLLSVFLVLVLALGLTVTGVESVLCDTAGAAEENAPVMFKARSDARPLAADLKNPTFPVSRQVDVTWLTEPKKEQHADP